MAASMLNGCRRFLHNSSRFRWKDATSRQYGTSTTGAYCIFLPEVPLDTKETNPIMRTDQFPCFTQLHRFNMITGCAKLSFEYDLLYEDLLEKLTEGAAKGTVNELSFDEFFPPLESVLMPLAYAESTANVLYFGNPKEYHRDLLDRVRGQINRARQARFFNETVFKHVQRLASDADLTEPQRRLVEYYLNETRTNGSEITGNKRKKVRGRIDMIIDKENEFIEKTMLHASTFNRTLSIEDWEIVRELPKQLRTIMSQDPSQPDRGPWVVSLGEKVFEPFIEYCPRRGLRASVWVDRHLVGTHKTGDVRTHTFQLIDDIRMHRSDISKEIGFSCYAEMMNEYRMAESVDAVIDMLNKYRKHFLPMAKVEIESLKAFIAERGLDVDLQQWDIPYFRRLQAEQIYKVNRFDRRQYFSLERVLDTMFKFTGNLFQLKIEKAKEQFDVWHEDVTVYKVHNLDGSLVGTIYLDLFARTASKILYSSELVGRTYSKQMNCTPISYLLMEFTKSNNPEVPDTISYKDVQQLFYQFGGVLRNLLSENEFGELNNDFLMEMDAVNMLPNLMQYFAQTPRVVKEFSDHVLSGEKMSDKGVENLVMCQNHMVGYDMCYQIYYSACDMEFHADTEMYWKDIQTEMYKKYMPIPINFEDWGFASDPTLWLGRSEAASYYKRIWSKMLAANVLESFRDAGLDDDKAMANVGKRLRSTILAPGAGADPLTLYRRFMGCNPSFEALTRLYPAYKQCEQLEEEDEE